MQATASSPETDLVRDLAGFVKFVLHATGREFFEFVEEVELSMSQMRILYLLAHGLEEASVKELADSTRLSMAAVSRAVDGLVQRGFVTRSENAADRRQKTVRPTDDGFDVVDRALELRVAGMEDFVASLTARERTRLAAALSPIVAREEIAHLCPGARNA